MDDLDSAVGDPQPAQLKHRRPPGRSCRGRTRPRRDRPGPPRGVPIRTVAPSSSTCTREQRSMTTFMSCSISRIPQPKSSSTLAEDRDQLLALRLVQPGRRLVEQQVARPDGERAGDAQQALAPRRQEAGRALRLLEQAEAARARRRRSRPRAACRPRCPSHRRRRSRATVRSAKGRAAWKVRPSPARASRAGEQPVTSTPSSKTVPESGAWKPLRTLTSVVLPAPFGPISPSASPGAQRQVDLLSAPAGRRRRGRLPRRAGLLGRSSRGPWPGSAPSPPTAGGAGGARATQPRRTGSAHPPRGHRSARPASRSSSPAGSGRGRSRPGPGASPIEISAEEAGAVLDAAQQLVDRRHRDRPDHRAEDAAGAADDQHRHRRHGGAEVEGGRD